MSSFAGYLKDIKGFDVAVGPAKVYEVRTKISEGDRKVAAAFTNPHKDTSDKDPKKHKDARMFRRLSYLDVLNRGLEVMDSTAISLCRDNNLPILVFNMTKPGNIRRVLLGEPLGTMVLDERREPRPGTNVAT